MRTLGEIQKAKVSKRRGWGRDLYLHILPMLDQLLTMGEISQKLYEMAGIETTENDLWQIKNRYADKVKQQPSPAPVTPARFMPPGSASDPSPNLVQKREVSQPISAPSPTSQPVRNYKVEKDYRTPVPKPTSIFETKKAPDQ